MALDIGEVRCGIAISDPAMRVASPVCVLPSSEVLANARSFRRIIEDWEPELLLSGLPLTLGGEQGPQAMRIQEQARAIASMLDLPLEFCDERLSSTEAKRSLREAGMNEKAMRGKVDSVAAAIFLQAWLDARQ
jgi:putative Holliday junction resolvase